MSIRGRRRRLIGILILPLIILFLNFAVMLQYYWDDWTLHDIHDHDPWQQLMSFHRHRKNSVRHRLSEKRQLYIRNATSVWNESQILTRLEENLRAEQVACHHTADNKSLYQALQQWKETNHTETETSQCRTSTALSTYSVILTVLEDSTTTTGFDRDDFARRLFLQLYRIFLEADVLSDVTLIMSNQMADQVLRGNVDYGQRIVQMAASSGAGSQQKQQKPPKLNIIVHSDSDVSSSWQQVKTSTSGCVLLLPVPLSGTTFDTTEIWRSWQQQEEPLYSSFEPSQCHRPNVTATAHAVVALDTRYWCWALHHPLALSSSFGVTVKQSIGPGSTYGFLLQWLYHVAGVPNQVKHPNNSSDMVISTA